MANTITVSALTEIAYKAMDTVSREPTGFIQSVLVNSAEDGVSINGTVTSHVTAQPTLNTSITPAMTIPAGDDQTVTVDTMTISQTANVRIPLNGETLKKLDNTSGSGVVLEDMMKQAMRVIVNTVESHVGTVLKNGSSRATGTAGTNPFATNQNPLTDVRQILVDNGVPNDGQLSLVINTSAGTKLRQLSNLYKVNEGGDGGALLRRGEITSLMGFSIKESAGVATHTKGTLAGSPTITNAGFAVGATSLTLSSAGTGTIVTGDALSIANDTSNVYIVGTGDTDVSDGGTLVINGPGLRKATGASTRALTVAADYTANIAFHRNACELVMRPPAMPPGGDAAVSMFTVRDPITGLVFSVCLYNGYKMNMIDITCYYQAKVWKSANVATLLG